MNKESKHFKLHEIIGYLPDGSLYLKMGVTRKHYNDKLDYEDMSQLNQQLIHAERLADKLKTLFGTHADEKDEE